MAMGKVEVLEVDGKVRLKLSDNAYVDFDQTNSLNLACVLVSTAYKASGLPVPPEVTLILLTD